MIKHYLDKVHVNQYKLNILQRMEVKRQEVIITQVYVK